MSRLEELSTMSRTDMARMIIRLELLRKQADELAWEVKIRIEAHGEGALALPYLAYRAARGDK